MRPHGLSRCIRFGLPVTFRTLSMASGSNATTSSAGGRELVDHVQGRRFADVIRFRLEGQSPQGNFLSLQVAFEVIPHRIKQGRLLRFIDAHNAVEDGEIKTAFCSRFCRGPAHPFGKQLPP